MRKGFLRSIAALAAGAGSAFGQAPVPVAPAGGAQPAVMAPSGTVVPAQGQNPVIMPPVTVGPPGDPQGFGPSATLGPPPGPMYPPPGPYAAPLFQPPPPPPEGSRLDGLLTPRYGVAPRVWFTGEYLMWFITGQPVDFPLLTTSSPNQRGVLGQPTTISLVPNTDIGYNVLNGFRLSGGFFGDADRRFGAEVTGFYTAPGRYDRQFSANQPGSVGIPVLARPYVDPNIGQTSLVLGSPTIGLATAKILTATSNWGVEASAVWNLFRTAPGSSWVASLDFLAGYKFYQNEEYFVIDSFSTLTGITVNPIFRPGPFGVPVRIGTRIVPNVVPLGGVNIGAPATVEVTDRITVQNRFNGTTIGFRGELRYGMWNLTTIGKIGAGNMHQTLDIQGTTAFANAQPRTGGVIGIPQNGSSFGGLYANAANIGRYNNDTFAVIPEVTMNVGLNLTRTLSMHVGYNFLYVNRVIRPGPHLNANIDSSTVPFRPEFGATGLIPGSPVRIVQDDLWIQGLNAGFTFRY